MDAHRHLIEMREELDLLHRRLDGIAPDDPTLESLLERAGELQHHLELADEHALEPEARRVLGGLGFSRADQESSAQPEPPPSAVARAANSSRQRSKEPKSRFSPTPNPACLPAALSAPSPPRLSK